MKDSELREAVLLKELHEAVVSKEDGLQIFGSDNSTVNNWWK